MRVLILMRSFEYLGLEYIASCLKLANYKTKLIFDPMLFSDVYMNTNGLAKYYDATNAIIRDAKEYNPDFILFSMLSDDVLWVRERAKQLKAVTNAIVIVGGVHPTAVPEKVVKYPYFDYVVTGEGEEILPKLLHNLSRDISIDEIRGVFYKRNGQIFGEMNNSLIQDLDIYPAPDKEMFYSVAPWAKKEYSLIVSRGCPYNCTYCHNNYLKKIWDGNGKYIRVRSVSNVINELIDSKRKYDFTTLNIWDDNILALGEYAFDFFDEYASKVGVPFKTFVHPLSINERTVKLLADAKCWKVEVGVQTTDKRGRQICGRNETNESIRNAISLLKDAGIEVSADVITGLPYESYEQLYSMAKFFAQTKPDRILAFLLRYYPKTDIMKIGLESGALDEKDWDLIEEGEYIASFTSQTRINDKQFNRLRGLVMISNNLSEKMVTRLERLNAEKWIPDISGSMQFINQIKGFIQPYNDLARLHRKKHLYYIRGDGQKWIKGDEKFESVIYHSGS